MGWEKLGRIFNPEDFPQAWYQHSFMTPTPMQLTEETIRIYGGLRDHNGVSRIGYVDVSSADPRHVINHAKTPVLDIGQPGTFDDNGLILGDVVREKNGNIRMYYVGFQLVKNVKFLAFSGLAISADNGENFKRMSQAPILDRADHARYIHAIHTVLYEDGIWKIWYSAGDDWKNIGGQDFPRYDIWYAESADGVSLNKERYFCIGVGANEYRIGRPRVIRTPDGYEMRFTADTLDKQYRAGWASSKDGKTWERNDERSGLTTGPEPWDSEMVCYPVIHRTPDHTYMFYSGNGMGKTGLGAARWTGKE